MAADCTLGTMSCPPERSIQEERREEETAYTVFINTRRKKTSRKTYAKMEKRQNKSRINMMGV
jgi:hypothetical protein